MRPHRANEDAPPHGRPREQFHRRDPARTDRRRVCYLATRGFRRSIRISPCSGTRSPKRDAGGFSPSSIGRGDRSTSLARGAGICAQRRHADCVEARPLGALDEAVDRNHRGTTAERHRVSQSDRSPRHDDRARSACFSHVSDHVAWPTFGVVMSSATQSTALADQVSD